MVQQENTLAAKFDNLGLIPETNMAEKKNWLLPFVL